jgi:hypothetical protein
MEYTGGGEFCLPLEVRRVLTLVMQALLVTLKPFLDGVIFELKAFSSWRRTRHLGHMVNGAKSGWGYTGKVAKSQII